MARYTSGDRLLETRTTADGTPLATLSLRHGKRARRRFAASFRSFFFSFSSPSVSALFPDSLARSRTDSRSPNFLGTTANSARETEATRSAAGEHRRRRKSGSTRARFLTSKWPFQDVAAFSEDSFDVKEWINRTFKSAEAQENKDVSRTGPPSPLPPISAPVARSAPRDRRCGARRPPNWRFPPARAPVVAHADPLLSKTLLFFALPRGSSAPDGGRYFYGLACLVPKIMSERYRRTINFPAYSAHLFVI